MRKILVCLILPFMLYGQKIFTYRSALDLISTFNGFTIPSFENDDECQSNEECMKKYYPHLRNARAYKRQILEAKKVIFLELVGNKNLQHSPQIYLHLANMAFRESKFYLFDEILVYLKSFLNNGGSKDDLSKNYRFILDSSNATIENLIAAYMNQNIDSPLLAKGFLPLLPNKQESFFGIYYKNQMQEQCMDIIGNIALRQCVLFYEDVPLVLPFRGNIFWFKSDMIGYQHQDTIPIYAHITYTIESTPFICALNPRITDQGNLDSDLKNAHISKEEWEEELKKEDMFANVTYIGFVDIFNINKKIPVAVVDTHIANDKAHRFFEAMTLNPQTMLEDLSLSHPIMNIQGRIPNLFFTFYEDKIVGCVISDDKKEEKVLLFNQDSTPTLIAHNILKSRFHTLIKDPNAPTLGKKRCAYKEFCDDGFLYLGFNVLQEMLINKNKYLDPQWLKSLDKCGNNKQCLGVKIKEYIISIE